jgi:hypothetical protein
LVDDLVVYSCKSFFELTTDHGIGTKSPEMVLIHRGVEPKEADMGVLVDLFDSSKHLLCQTGGGMHWDVKPDQVRLTNGLKVEFGCSEILKAYIGSGCLEPGCW